MNDDILKLSAIHLAELNYRQTRIQLYGAMVQNKLQQVEIVTLKATNEMRQARLEADAGKKEMERLQADLKDFCSSIESSYGVDFASCSWDDTTGAIEVLGTSTKG